MFGLPRQVLQRSLQRRPHIRRSTDTPDDGDHQPGEQVAEYAIGQSIPAYNLQMAASTIMTIPIIVLFFVAQRYFMRGIVTTGLAGR